MKGKVIKWWLFRAWVGLFLAGIPASNCAQSSANDRRTESTPATSTLTIGSYSLTEQEVEIELDRYLILENQITEELSRLGGAREGAWNKYNRLAGQPPPDPRGSAAQYIPYAQLESVWRRSHSRALDGARADAEGRSQALSGEIAALEGALQKVGSAISILENALAKFERDRGETRLETIEKIYRGAVERLQNSNSSPLIGINTRCSLSKDLVERLSRLERRISRLGDEDYLKKVQNKTELARSVWGAEVAVLGDSRQPRAWLDLGAAYAKWKWNNDAVAAYSYCIRLDPKGMDAWSAWGAMGAAYEGMKNYERAVWAYEQGVKFDAGNPPYWVWNDLGRASALQGNYEKAITCCRNALQKEANGNSWFWLAWTYHAQKKYDEAIIAIRKAIELAPYGSGPWMGGALVELGDIYADQEKYVDAALAYEDATKTDPDSVEGWYKLGLTSLKLRLNDKTLDAIRRLEKLSPDDANKLKAELIKGR